MSLLLAKEYDPEKHNPTGWYVSEKLDGYRALWNPATKTFSSRLDNNFVVPEFFIKNAPDVCLDGELWHGRNKDSFSKTSTVRKQEANEEEWANLTYVVFDAPEHKGTYEERMKFLKELLPSFDQESKEKIYFKVITIWPCTGHDHLMSDLKKYEKIGAEGLMIRKPGSLYERKRSGTLLKVKSSQDAEAEIIGYILGTKGSKYDGLLGSYKVKNNKGHVFNIGSGLKDIDRIIDNIIPNGTIITYKHNGLTNHGKPRNPIFLRIRQE